MNIELITVFSDPIAIKPLMRSIERQNFPFTAIEVDWKGFGTKLLAVHDYLTNDVMGMALDGFFFCDANDVLVLGGIDEAVKKIRDNYGLDKIVCSSERGCWPDGQLEKYYEPHYDHGFNFLNSGLYYANREKYLKLFEKDPPAFSSDDQLWLTHKYLFGDYGIVLDNDQKVFNSHSFIRECEYKYIEYRDEYNRKSGGRIEILDNQPVFVHKNGRSVDEKLDNLINYEPVGL